VSGEWTEGAKRRRGEEARERKGEENLSGRRWPVRRSPERLRREKDEWTEGGRDEETEERMWKISRRI